MPPTARTRNLRKKLVEIEALERRIAEEGFNPSEDQLEKVARKAQLEAELAALEAPPPAPKEPQPVDASISSKKRELRKPAADLGADEDLLRWMQAGAAVPPVGASSARRRKPAPLAKEEPTTQLPTTAPKPVQDVSGQPPCSPPPRSPLCSPSLRWRDDPLGVEDVEPMAPSSKRESFEFIEGVLPFSASAQTDERLRGLLREASELSMAAFEEDALEMVTRRNRWKLTLLARTEDEDSWLLLDEEPNLIGFVIYRLRPETSSFSIAKLAVVPEHRRRGHGCRLIDWCVRQAKKAQNVSFVSLSSLPEAVCFYKRLGFRKFDNISMSQGCDPDEELVEGQVYMEKAIKGRGGGRRK